MNSVPFRPSLAVALASALASTLLTGCGNDPSKSGAAGDRIVPTSGSADTIKLSQVYVGLGQPILDLQLASVYSILPPAPALTGGIPTYASDLVVSGGRAYTAFNSVSDPQAGSVDVIDLALEIGMPTIASSQRFTDFDVNAVRVVGSEVWLMGALQDVGAWFRVFPIGTGGAIGSKRIEGALPSYAGTGVSAATAGHVFVSSGDAGGISTVNTTTGATTQVANVPDARDVKLMPNGDFVTVSGTPGTLSRFTATGSPVWTAAIGGASIAQSKSSVIVGSTYIAATKGDGGVSIVCAADGKIMASVAPSATGGVTNAVTSAPGVIITADGGDGVTIHMIQASSTGPASACPKIELAQLGHIAFADGISANNISTGNFALSLGLLGIRVYTGRVYVAAGASGFRTLSLTYTAAALTGLVDL